MAAEQIRKWIDHEGGDASVPETGFFSTTGQEQLRFLTLGKKLPDQTLTWANLDTIVNGLGRLVQTDEMLLADLALHPRWNPLRGADNHWLWILRGL